VGRVGEDQDGLDPALVDVHRLLQREVAALAGHEPGVGGAHLQGLHPHPQLREAVHQVQGVGHQVAGGIRRDAEAATQLGRGELGHLGRAVAACKICTSQRR